MNEKSQRQSNFDGRSGQLATLHLLFRPDTQTMQERAAFSAGLYGVAHCAVILALAVRPTRYRWLLFLPAASIYLYLPFKTTTGDATTDLGIGSALICQLLFAADYILVTEVQRELRLVAQTRPITSSGFFERLRWAINLFFSPRGIGWMHAPSVIPRPPQSTSRSLFVRNRIVEGILCVFFELTVYFMNVTNPAMIDVEKGSSRQYGLYYQAMGVLGFALAGYARINVLFCVTSVAAVVFGLSEPKDWPDLFGSIWEAYSVRRFWRFVVFIQWKLELHTQLKHLYSRTWHQLLRRVCSHSRTYPHK